MRPPTHKKKGEKSNLNMRASRESLIIESNFNEHIHLSPAQEFSLPSHLFLTAEKVSFEENFANIVMLSVLKRMRFWEKLFNLHTWPHLWTFPWKAGKVWDFGKRRRNKKECFDFLNGFFCFFITVDRTNKFSSTSQATPCSQSEASSQWKLIECVLTWKIPTQFRFASWACEDTGGRKMDTRWRSIN